MDAYRILIVEDELLIADMIDRYITRRGWEVVGIATTYEEAEFLYHQAEPDLVLLDVRLSSSRNGIDFAYFLQEQQVPVPFIFLTSQFDSRTLDLAKETYPAGYLSKPFQKGSLYGTIEVAMHRYDTDREKEEAEKESLLKVFDGKKHLHIPIQDILYLKSDHVYVEILLNDNSSINTRIPLAQLMEKLPVGCFVQTHRSYIINLCQVTQWDNVNIYIQSQRIPVSRSRRKLILSRLNAK
ncbi:MAG: response regulator transcription factor [Bacteroidota bacterium]